MRFGLFIPFQNPSRWARPYPELYQEHLHQIVRAEELGYDNIWLTEHHFDQDGYSPSLLPLAAGIATRTQRIRIGTFILILPLHNALQVAEDAATIDILSNGRFDLGVGKGYRVNEFAGFGIPHEQRATLLEEGIEVIRRAWTEEHFSFSGQHYQLADVNLTPRPVQQPHPPLWIGARGKKAVERAARLGCHLMGSTGDVEPQPVYDQALQRYGRNPQDFSILQQRLVYLAESREKAWDDVEEHLFYFFNTVLPMIKEAGDLPTDQAMQALPNAKVLRQLDPTSSNGTPIIGTPEDCIQALEGCQRATRVTHMALGMHAPGLAPNKVMRSIELFAREVMPHFQRGQM